MRTKRRAAFSLLEVMVALALLALVVAPVLGMLRASQQVWEDQQRDVAAWQSAHGAVRQMRRTLRRAKRVEVVSAPDDTQGRLIVRTPDNRTLRWWLDDGQLWFEENDRPAVLARGLRSLAFTGFAADGATITQRPVEMQFLEVEVGLTLDRRAEPVRHVRSKIWLRTF